MMKGKKAKAFGGGAQQCKPLCKGSRLNCCLDRRKGASHPLKGGLALGGAPPSPGARFNCLLLRFWGLPLLA